MLDYKSIIIKRYALGLSYKELAEEFSASKSGINDFIRAFERCEKLSYPLPEGITNYAIYELVYGHEPGTNRRNELSCRHNSANHLRQLFHYLYDNGYTATDNALYVLKDQYRKQCKLPTTYTEEVLTTHDVTWMRRDSFCRDQYVTEQPEEVPSMPVKTRIFQIEPPKQHSGFEKFNFEEGLWDE